MGVNVRESWGLKKDINPAGEFLSIEGLSTGTHQSQNKATSRIVKIYFPFNKPLGKYCAE